jgi:hypothetical protein
MYRFPTPIPICSSLSYSSKTRRLHLPCPQHPSLPYSLKRWQSIILVRRLLIIRNSPLKDFRLAVLTHAIKSDLFNFVILLTFLFVFFVLLASSIRQVLVYTSIIADFKGLLCALSAAAGVECVPVGAHLEKSSGNLVIDILEEDVS